MSVIIAVLRNPRLWPVALKQIWRIENQTGTQGLRFCLFLRSHTLISGFTLHMGQAKIFRDWLWTW